MLFITITIYDIDFLFVLLKSSLFHIHSESFFISPEDLGTRLVATKNFE